MKAAMPKVKRISLPNVSERRAVHIINPNSGSGRFYEAAIRSVEKTGGELLISKHPGHITELVAELFSGDPFAHAVIYGGDGTVNEAVNGIMLSGKNSTASFSVVPLGSGNDFSAYANDSGIFNKAELVPVDLIRTNADGKIRYAANVMNMGFDSDVVRETYTLKKYPMLHGQMAYIAGVLKVLMQKKTIPAKIRLEGCVCEGEDTSDIEADQSLSIDQRVLLTACANAQFYGGGFRAAPLASITDGLMDVLVVNDVSRMQFISLVGDYKKGTFINESGELKERFKKIMRYRKCRKLTVEGPMWFCIDGEVLHTGEEHTIEAEVMQNAVWFAAL